MTRLPASVTCAGMVAVAWLCAGCVVTKEIPPDRLPVYGHGKLKHTVYLGSDERFHYFYATRDLSESRLKVKTQDAEIRPGTFHISEDKDAFVDRVEGSTIHLRYFGVTTED